MDRMRAHDLSFAEAIFVPAIAAILGLVGCTRESDSPSSKAPPVEVRSETAWQAEYDEMVSVLGLRSDEAQRLRTAFEQREAEAGEWLKGERGKSLAQLEGQLKQAAKGKNAAETKQIIAKATPLRKELMSIIDRHQANILGALSPERQVQWQGHKVAEKLLETMASLKLDPTQQQYIRNGAVEAIGRALQARQPNPPAAAFLELEQWAENSVLSPAQRQAYQETKKKAPVRSLAF